MSRLLVCHNLLDADERALIERLSLFPVAFGLDAVLAIASADVDALALLGRLVDKSLVNVDRIEAAAISSSGTTESVSQRSGRDRTAAVHIYRTR
jgi:predicted ATPase